MIAVIDNYDSFTYNLVQMLAETGAEIQVFRNDRISPDELEAMHPEGLVISPGPGRPSQAGVSKEMIRHFTGICPVLGICLGHQAINEVFGGNTIKAVHLMHGKAGQIRLYQSVLFDGLPEVIEGARYHSLEAEPAELPECLKVIADEDGEIMGIEHQDYPVYGLQFHPESILTPKGAQILENFLNIVSTNKNQTECSRQANGNTAVNEAAGKSGAEKKTSNHHIADNSALNGQTADKHTEHTPRDGEQRRQKMESNVVAALKDLIAGKNLDDTEAKKAFSEIMEGQATEAQTAAFLTALSIKGETPSEIAACADVMRSCAVPLNTAGETLEIVGTGGDRTGTFNISTASAIVCAAAGVKAAKHGNRSVSSRSGAADCLEALGFDITLGAEENSQMLSQTGFCFMFAPVYHKAMKNAAGVRKQLAVPTVFNILGPLANPAGATRQLLGVYSEELIMPMAEALQKLGVTHGLVVHGCDGLDEISNTADTSACLIEGEKLTRLTIRPEDFGYQRCSLPEIQGKDAQDNARIIRDVFDGKQGPQRDIVCMNAGAALMLAGAADTIEAGVRMAEAVIDSGKAAEKLDQASATSVKLGNEERKSA